MMAGTLIRYMAVSLVLAAGWAVSAQAQIMYAGPGTIVQQQFWSPQVYGYNTYPYIAPGPYTYAYVVPPGGAILTPYGYVPYPPRPVPRPFAYGYPPNPYRPRIPNSYGPPPQPHRGYQPGPNRPRFVSPYDPPAVPRQSATPHDDTAHPQKQDETTVPGEHDGQAVTDPATGRAEGGTQGPPQGYVMPGRGARGGPVEQGGRATTEQEPKGTVAQSDPNGLAE